MVANLVDSLIPFISSIVNISTINIAGIFISIDICKNGDAFAYPYGDYTDSCVEAVKDAGFICAVTTEYGRTNPGDNPLLLPRVRMLEGQSLESFIKLVE